jgi:hypothetical protein
MSYLLIIVLTVSGSQDVRLRVTPDLQSCMFQSESAKSWAASVPGEWRLSTKCIPIPETTEV